MNNITVDEIRVNVAAYHLRARDLEGAARYVEQGGVYRPESPPKRDEAEREIDVLFTELSDWFSSDVNADTYVPTNGAAEALWRTMLSDSPFLDWASPRARYFDETMRKVLREDDVDFAALDKRLAEGADLDGILASLSPRLDNPSNAVLVLERKAKGIVRACLALMLESNRAVMLLQTLEQLQMRNPLVCKSLVPMTAVPVLKQPMANAGSVTTQNYRQLLAYDRSYDGIPPPQPQSIGYIAVGDYGHCSWGFGNDPGSFVKSFALHTPDVLFLHELAHLIHFNTGCLLKGQELVKAYYVDNVAELQNDWFRSTKDPVTYLRGQWSNNFDDEFTVIMLNENAYRIELGRRERFTSAPVRAW